VAGKRAVPVKRVQVSIFGTLDRRLAWLFSDSPGKCHECTTKQAIIASFQ
jgi:hypothetical protein